MYTRKFVSIMTSMARDEIFTRNSSSMDQSKPSAGETRPMSSLCVSSKGHTAGLFPCGAVHPADVSITPRQPHNDRGLVPRRCTVRVPRVMYTAAPDPTTADTRSLHTSSDCRHTTTEHRSQSIGLLIKGIWVQLILLLRLILAISFTSHFLSSPMCENEYLVTDNSAFIMRVKSLPQ